MDPLTLAGRAVSFLVGYLTQVASGVVQRTQHSAAETLYDLIAARLRGTPAGQQILGNLETNPEDDQAAHDAKQILATEAQHDQTFATELSRAMHNVWHTLGGVSESTVEQVNITTSGATMRKSVIAAGNVDQSRRQTKISFGGLGIIAAIVLLGGTGSVIAVSLGSDDVGPIGADPGEVGARETAETFVDAVGSNDTELLCDLLMPETVDMLEISARRPCSEVFTYLMEEVPYEARQKTQQAEVLSLDMQPQHRALAVVGIPGSEEDPYELHLRYKDDRWRVDADRYKTLQFGTW